MRRRSPTTRVPAPRLQSWRYRRENHATRPVSCRARVPCIDDTGPGADTLRGTAKLFRFRHASATALQVLSLTLTTGSVHFRTYERTGTSEENYASCNLDVGKSIDRTFPDCCYQPHMRESHVRVNALSKESKMSTLHQKQVRRSFRANPAGDSRTWAATRHVSTGKRLFPGHCRVCFSTIHWPLPASGWCLQARWTKAYWTLFFETCGSFLNAHAWSRYRVVVRVTGAYRFPKLDVVQPSYRQSCTTGTCGAHCLSVWHCR